MAKRWWLRRAGFVVVRKDSEDRGYGAETLPAQNREQIAQHHDAAGCRAWRARFNEDIVADTSGSGVEQGVVAFHHVESTILQSKQRIVEMGLALFTCTVLHHTACRWRSGPGMVNH